MRVNQLQSLHIYTSHPTNGRKQQFLETIQNPDTNSLTYIILILRRLCDRIMSDGFPVIVLPQVYLTYLVQDFFFVYLIHSCPHLVLSIYLSPETI